MQKKKAEEEEEEREELISRYLRDHTRNVAMQSASTAKEVRIVGSLRVSILLSSSLEMGNLLTT